MSDTGLVGFPLAAMKQAMHSSESSRIMLLPYDTLVNRPADAMAAVYAFTGVTPFTHDFEHVAFDATEFDARLGTPGLHSVRAQVKCIERRTILPPDLWSRYEGTALWRAADFNTHGVAIACEPAALASPAPADINGTQMVSADGV